MNDKIPKHVRNVIALLTLFPNPHITFFTVNTYFVIGNYSTNFDWIDVSDSISGQKQIKS